MSGNEINDNLEEEVTSRKRHKPTKESLLSKLDSLIKDLDDHIDKMRETQNGSKGVRFLRNVRNQVITVKKET